PGLGRPGAAARQAGAGAGPAWCSSSAGRCRGWAGLVQQLGRPVPGLGRPGAAARQAGAGAGPAWCSSSAGRCRGWAGLVQQLGRPVPGLGRPGAAARQAGAGAGPAWCSSSAGRCRGWAGLVQQLGRPVPGLGRPGAAARQAGAGAGPAWCSSSAGRCRGWAGLVQQLGRPVPGLGRPGAAARQAGAGAGPAWCSSSAGRCRGWAGLVQQLGRPVPGLGRPGAAARQAGAGAGPAWCSSSAGRCRGWAGLVQQLGRPVPGLGRPGAAARQAGAGAGPAWCSSSAGRCRGWAGLVQQLGRPVPGLGRPGAAARQAGAGAGPAWCSSSAGRCRGWAGLVQQLGRPVPGLGRPAAALVPPAVRACSAPLVAAMSAGQAAAEEEDAAAESPALPRVLSALFYGASSFFNVLVNKALLSAYSFPSPVFLGIGQMAATILILYVSKLRKIVHFPDFDKSIPVKLFPLPLIYVGNHLSGLSSTSKLSLPMFTVLRKFTIPLTLLLEIIILGSDLSFNLEGYIFVLLNDIFTAANGVYTKQKIDPKELGKYGVLFYNACFMVIPTVIFSFSTGDFQECWYLSVNNKTQFSVLCFCSLLTMCTSVSSLLYVLQATHFQHWTNFLFVFQFILSCLLGFLLMYSTVLCSYYNSALTTTVIGAIKNISIAYIGMLIGGDYIFSMLNFVGLNICMAGGLRYSFLTLRGNSKPAQPGDEENALPVSKS
uniref:Solute carrier family 35 member D2 n=1 Tax=Ficedula albicollis TaxID=59894 RepID=A0A803V3Y2_FICAL